MTGVPVVKPCCGFPVEGPCPGCPALGVKAPDEWTGHCYRCAAGARPEEWCDGCPNRPKPAGKTWAEEAIERWDAMEPGDEATKLLHEIMREHWKSVTRREPRRLFKGTVVLRRIERNETRKSRMRRIEIWRYYSEGGRPWLAKLEGGAA